MPAPWEQFQAASAPPEMAGVPWEKFAPRQAPQAPPKGSGPDQTSWYERLWRGIQDTPEGIGQLVGRADAALLPGGELRRQAYDQRLKWNEQDYQKSRGENANTGDFMRATGAVASSAPLTALVPGAGATTIPRLMLSGAGQGALAAGTQPVYGDDFWKEKGKDVLTGAGAGAAAAGIIGGLSRVISPNVSPELQRLVDAQVDVSPGRATEGVAKDVEGMLRDVRVGGGFARAADQRSIGQFNVAAANEMRKALGVAPLDTRTAKAGAELIASSKGALDDAYRSVATQLSGAVDDGLVTDLSMINRIGKKLEPEVREQLVEAIKPHARLLTEGNALTGQELISAKRAFKDLAYEARIADAPEALREAYKTAESAIDSFIKRINPDAYSALGKADAGNRLYLTLRNAAGRALEDNVFSPQQLAQASRKIGGETAFATGQAPMQPIAQAGMAVLDKVQRYPARGDIWSMVGSPVTGAIGTLTSPAYTATGQRWLTQALANRPSYARALADALRGTIPQAATGAGVNAAR